MWTGSLSLFPVLAMVCAAASPLARAAEPVAPAVDTAVAQIAAELQQLCPLADTGDQAAFDRCRKALFAGSGVKARMSSPVLWGRQRHPALTLKDSSLTQFAPDVLSGMYLPLFMFNGSYSVRFHEGERKYLATLGATFRNRLQPGQFPYPFWHDDQKWSAYENANVVLLWMDATSLKVQVVQFAPTGSAIPGYPLAHVTPPAFDGKWLWTDARGATQPAVTLFDGLYAADNPYKKALDASYRELAIALRESQCLSCHVPDNPDKMKRLLLLQSPAHAAAEIQRVLKSVRDKKMPLDDLGLPTELEPTVAALLLDKGAAFEKLVIAARMWEQSKGAPARLEK